MNPLQALQGYGHSVWLDYIRRSLLTSGEFAYLIEKDGLRGVTSNSAIFEKAITGSTDYVDMLRALAPQYRAAKALHEGEAGMIKIAPSILAADFWQLGEQGKATEEAGVDRFHIDVMDGRFVPNINLGMPIVKAMRRGTSFPLEMHLMIVEPKRYVEAFMQAWADIVIVHQEATPHLHRTVQMIKQRDKKVGVGLNPSTPDQWARSKISPRTSMCSW